MYFSLYDTVLGQDVDGRQLLFSDTLSHTSSHSPVWQPTASAHALQQSLAPSFGTSREHRQNDAPSARHPTCASEHCTVIRYIQLYSGVHAQEGGVFLLFCSLAKGEKNIVLKTDTRTAT